MLTIIFSWTILFSAIFLIGRLILKTGLLSFLNIKEEIEWYEYFWMGFVVVIAILQIWSFFLPVNVLSLAFILMLSGIALFITFKKGFHLPKISASFVIISILVLLAISYFASLSGGWPDTHGYHLSIVKWGSAYKVVPGLANLYTRLGFNSSFFLLASMIDNLFLKDRSSHIALSLMASVLSIEFIWIFLKSKNNFLKVFILLSLPIFVEGIVHSVQVSSLSYDFTVLIIILVTCLELIKGDRKSIIIAAALSMMLTTIKLSGAVFALVVVAFCAYKLVSKKQERTRTIIYLCSIGLILFVPYVLRNIILSGWPLYPLPILGLNLPWTVPQERVATQAVVIKAWAILPGIRWPTVVGLPFLQWFPGWLSRNAEKMELKIFCLTPLLFIASVFLKFINRRAVKKNVGLVICMVASFVSIVYLMLSAPDFRFGAIYFWVFFASVGSFFFIGLFKRNPKLLKILIIFSIFLTVSISWPPRMDSEIMLKSIRWDQPGGTYQVLVTPNDGSPPFRVYTPRDDSSCGNTELPCTSEVSNDFKEIVPGNIFGGFVPTKQKGLIKNRVLY